MTGSPTPEVEWSKVVGSSSAKMVVEDGRLKLFNVTKEEEGEYECAAKNTVGFDYSRTKLEVIQVPVKPPEVLVVFEGDDTSVGCQATGNIQPHMKWSKSDEDLPAGSRALSLADGTLKLMSIQQKDAGEYVCNASVETFGFNIGKMQLIVLGKPSRFSQNKDLSTLFRSFLAVNGMCSRPTFFFPFSTVLVEIV